MDNYEMLVDALGEEVSIKEVLSYEQTKDIVHSYKGTIFIEKSLSTVKKRERLREKYGHYRTSVGNILSQNVLENRKQEKEACTYGMAQTIGLDGLIDTWNVGYKYHWGRAEFSGLTTQCVIDSVRNIREMYGINFTYKSLEFRFITENCIEIIE